MKSNYCFPKPLKLAKPAEFKLVYQNNNIRVGGRYFLILAFSSFSKLNKNTTKPARIGVVASKKVSKRAVIRNKMKRLIRESFRTSSYSDKTSDIDYVVVTKIGADKIENKNLNQELSYLWKKMHKQCQNKISKNENL